jgi:hypothetical protein
MLMKKRDINPVGPLIVDYLKEHSSSLYDYLLKKKTNEAQVAKEITEDIDKHFRAGFVLHWNDCLNHCKQPPNLDRPIASQNNCYEDSRDNQSAD